jgi:hypothetical protein
MSNAPKNTALPTSAKNLPTGSANPRLRRSATLRCRAARMKPINSSNMPMRLAMRWNFGLSSHGDMSSHAG